MVAIGGTFDDPIGLLASPFILWLITYEEFRPFGRDMLDLI